MRNPISHDTQCVCVCVCVFKDTTRKRVARQLDLLLVFFFRENTQIALPVPPTFDVFGPRKRTRLFYFTRLLKQQSN
jgi:hypothetical protein